MDTICSLDYLIGTLATAYKGMISSLVAKDFCITETNGTITFRGNLLSMPAVNYSICLMLGSHEIARSGISDGYFELTTDIPVLENAKSLQLDVIQNGRHIGTFLLKRVSKGGFYVSALEISRELAGINLKALVQSVWDKRGLQKKAESLAAAILSTKKDWRALSNEINTFSSDLFWSSREAFYLWFPLLVRFSSEACTQVGADSEKKAVSNFLTLLELPLEKETSGEKLMMAAETWIEKMGGKKINLSARFTQTLSVLRSLSEKAPALNIAPLAGRLLASLKVRVHAAPVIGDETIRLFAGDFGAPAVSALSAYSESARKNFLEEIEEAENLLQEQMSPSELLNVLDGMTGRLADESAMVESLFRVLKQGLAGVSDTSLTIALREISRLLDSMGKDSYHAGIRSFTGLIKMLLSKGRTGTCITSFQTLSTSPMRDAIVLNREIAEVIVKSADPDLINSYRSMLTAIIIPRPGISGFSSETWAEVVNPVHLSRLSKFLGVLTLDTEMLRDVLIHVISNVYVSGVFIPDDRLFQREVSAYLNSGVLRNDYLLHHILLKKFPVYFNEIGASGNVRELTTEIDSWGNDPVIYFLRKQVHVNASSNNIALVEGIIKAWLSHDSSHLRDIVPAEVLANFDAGVLEKYSHVARASFDALDIRDGSMPDFGKLLSVSDDVVQKAVENTEGDEEAKKKIILLCRIYRGISAKYDLRTGREKSDGHGIASLSEHVTNLEKLKRTYLSPDITSAHESLYFKRHIAFGIPSVMGSFHEPKFDAFSEALRVEEKVRITFEEIIGSIEGSGKDLTPDLIEEWLRCLEWAQKLLAFHGIANRQIEEVVSILKTNRLHLSQVVDLLRIWQKELTWEVEIIYRTFHKPLVEILGNFLPDDLPDSLKRLGPPGEDLSRKGTDIIIRDIMNSIAGFEEIDRMVNSLIKTFSRSTEAGGDREICLSLTGDKAAAWFDLRTLSPEEAAYRSPLLGSKAKNLVYLIAKNLPVPPGVVLSSSFTGSFEDFTESGDFQMLLRDAVKTIEAQTGHVFGGSANPLFLSVRSGSYISMPGILSSILYCGMNDDTAKGFSEITGNPWLAWDSYRRFIEHYCAIVLGIDTGLFRAVVEEALVRTQSKDLRDIDAGGMKRIVGRYRDLLADKGTPLPQDVYLQLKESAKSVYRSWCGEKADNFRRAMKISAHWGTSVSLMKMISGNSRGAGASVFFTRDPVSLGKGIHGETREIATGDDLVYGNLTNRPLTRGQTGKGESLEEIDHDLYLLHAELAEKIEDAMGGLPQEVEAAYVSRKGRRFIYILQTKRMEFSRRLEVSFGESCGMESSIIGRGIGVHGGALSGIASFSSSADEIRKLKKMNTQPVILIRKEASTDDVSMMPEIEGIITEVGGVTSHAAILAQKFELTAVVSCSDMQIKFDGKKASHAIIGDYVVREGMPISIDGATGLVYSGICLLTTQKERYK